MHSKLLAELKKTESAGYLPAAGFVDASRGLGDKEEAFVWLEKAYQEKSNILQFVKTHPFLTRFAAIRASLIFNAAL